MDGAVAVFAVVTALVAGVLFGVIPALRLAGRAAQPPAPGRGDTPGRATRRLQRGLVVAEIALSIVPLVAAGLMLRTFLNLSHAPLGFQPDRVLTVWMPISFRQFADFDARWAVHRDAIARLRTLPGVEAVSAVSPAPFGPLQFSRRYGRGDDPAPSAVASLQVVLPGFFDVAATRVVEGRDFNDEDLALRRQAVMIDSRIAHALWPQGAVGQKLALASGRKVVQLDIIGVTEPVRTRHVRDDITPQVFVAYHFFPVEMALAIRTSTASIAPGLEPAIKRTIAGLGTGRAVEVRPLSEFVRDSMAETRFMLLVLGAFALAAVLLAAVGLYGTLAYLASQRRREFGIRLALGSTRRQILRLVAGEGLRLTAIGALVGAAGAFAAAQVLRHLLYGVEAADPATLVAVGLVVFGLGIAACLRPAWTASRTNPMTTLSPE
jgi:putative ABC transport system permease protein